MGRLKTVLYGKGCGFIESTDVSGGDVFIHYSSFVNGTADDLVIGTVVRFDLQTNHRNGKVKAANVIITQRIQNGTATRLHPAGGSDHPIFDLGRCLLRIESLLEELVVHSLGNFGMMARHLQKKKVEQQKQPREFVPDLRGEWEEIEDKYEGNSTEEDDEQSLGEEEEEAAAASADQQRQGSGDMWADEEFKRTMLEMGSQLEEINTTLAGMRDDLSEAKT